MADPAPDQEVGAGDRPDVCLVVQDRDCHGGNSHAGASGMRNKFPWKINVKREEGQEWIEDMIWTG